MNKESKSFKTAVGGIITALSVLCMLLTLAFPTFTYVLPGFAGILLIPVFFELGVKWAFGVFVSVSAVSFFIAADREAAIMYIFFFGYYPILRFLIDDKIIHKPFSVFIKMTVFNISVVSAFILIIYIFKLPFEEMKLFGKYSRAVLLILGNIVFLIYEKTVDNFTFIYKNRIRQKLKGIFK